MITAEVAAYRYGLNIPQEKMDYDGNGLMIYEGYAPQNVATSVAQWMIFKHYYDATNTWVGRKALTNVIWDNRASLTF